MRRAQGDWLEQSATQALFDAFAQEGYQLHCVGGCVRNALLGEPVRDVDMSTNAEPAQVMELAKKRNLRCVPTGIDHGTVTVLKDEHPFEITTYRKDIETDGRHAEIAFAGSIEEDAQRRDLTINALYCDAQGAIIDPVGGLRDIDAKRVRFIGNADARIREDYLRILRFFRFYAWYSAAEGGIDADGLAACAELADGLEMLSGERIGHEMRKLLSAPDPAPAIAAMAQSGVLHRILPGAEASALPVLVHFESDHPPDWQRRRLVLGGEDVPDRWRLTKSETRTLAQLQNALASEASLAKLGYRLGTDSALSVALARAAILQTPPPADMEAQIAKGASAKFPITSADLMPRFEGPRLGAELKRLERLWISSDFKPGKAELLAL